MFHVAFDEPFWSPETQFFGVATGDTDSSSQATWWVSRLRDAGTPIIRAFYGGAFLLDEQILDLGNNLATTSQQQNNSKISSVVIQITLI